MKNFMLSFFILIAGVAFTQTVPYSVNKKKYPLGDEFEKLLPLKLGKWNRFAYHDFVPGQEIGRVYYTQGDDQIYLTFGKAYSQAGLNLAWTKIYDDATDGRQSQVKQKNIASPNNRYLLMNGKSGFFYAWTRNLYYFSIEAKSKTIVDEFMIVFPY